MNAVNPLAITENPEAPTLSETLQKFIQKHEISPRGETSNINKLASKKSVEIWRFFDRCDQAEMAARVLQGFCLARIRAASEQDFIGGLEARDIAPSAAYRMIDLYQLFNALPDLTKLRKAAELGVTRIRELQPELRLEGLQALIAHGEVNGLTYDQVSKMTKRDIVDWRRGQRQLRLKLRLAQARAAGLGDGEALKIGGEEEPREVTIGREEGQAIGWRIRSELALLQHVSADLEPEPGTELGSAHFGVAALIVKSIDEIVHDAERLQDALIDKFGESVGNADVLIGRDAKAAAMRKVWTAEVEEAAAERARERHQRYGWRGRPATRKAIPKKTGQRGRPRNGG